MDFEKCSHSLLRVRNGVVVGLVILSSLSFGARQSTAGFFTLSDENSVAQFDTGSQSNDFSWSVNGENQLNQQAFWYRVGNAAEQSLHSLPIAFESAVDANADPGLDTLSVRYLSAGSFRVDVKYSLDGGIVGSGASDMGEQITITNLSTSALNFHFFQYSDFDLLGTSGNDEAVFTNANTVRQSEGSLRLTESVVTPIPTHREIAFYNSTLLKLNDGVASNLNDLPAIGTPLGPGDVTWAYQWDVTIPGRGSFQISKDKNLSANYVPEPATLALLAFPALLVGMRRGRSRLFC